MLHSVRWLIIDKLLLSNYSGYEFQGESIAACKILHVQSRGHPGFITPYSSRIPPSPHSHQFLSVCTSPIPTEKLTRSCFLQNISFMK